MNCSTKLSCANALRQRSNFQLIQSDLAGRIQQSIDLTLTVDGHKWTRQTLNKCGAAFSSIVSACPSINTELLGQKLLASYFHRQGRCGFDSDDHDIMSLALDRDVLDNAALFMHAIGQLQP